MRIGPGKTRTVAEIDGPGAIQSIWIGGYVGPQFIVRMYWDGQGRPSVECPLADFFACGWRDNGAGPTGGPFSPLNSLPVVVNPNSGLNCFWPMPFRGHCRVTVENVGTQERACFYQINYALADVAEDAAYFHAQFRHSNPVPPGECHCLLDGVVGRGHYVGTALVVGLGGQNRWWGEGEIKFFLGGDAAYPTICGTGTEDYFGGSYNWEAEGRYSTYSAPFLGMYHVSASDGLYQGQQRFAMYRWHLVDPIRFERDTTLQDLGWRSGGRYLLRHDDFASVAYWYQTLPTAPFPPVPDVDALELV